MNDAPLVRTKSVPLPEGARAEFVESFDGAKIRLLRFAGGDRGTVLVVPGWAEPSEKYGEVALDLIDRGFTPAVFDPRGQGLSPRATREDTRGRLDDYAKAVCDLDAVIRHLNADRLVLLGHSMGGLAVLSWLAQGGEAEAAVLSAPATRIFPQGWQRLGVRGLTRVLCQLGFPDLPLSKEGGQAMEFEGNTLTSDPERHAYLRDLLLDDERLSLPRTTPAMVRTLHRAQSRLARRKTLADLKVPTRIVSLPNDQWVNASHHAKVAAMSEAIDLVEVPGSRHEILMERDEYRDAFWDAFDQHVDRYVPRRSADRT